MERTLGRLHLQITEFGNQPYLSVRRTDQTDPDLYAAGTPLEDSDGNLRDTESLTTSLTNILKGSGETGFVVLPQDVADIIDAFRQADNA